MNIDPEMTKKMLSDPKLRTKLTRESHKWFFYFYFPHYVTCDIAPFHHEMFALTEDESIKTLVIVAFRGSAKSTIFNMSYPIWSIIGKPQKKFVVILGLTQEQARQHFKNIKDELEQNLRLQADLGPFEEKNDLWRSHSLVIPKYGAKIIAISIDQSIRGLRHGPHRPDLIICDDLETLESVQTIDGRNKTDRCITGEVIPAGSRDTKIVFIGNLLHEDSLLMRLKERMDKDELDGEYREYPLVNKNGKCLWPGKFPTSKDIQLEQRRIGDDIAWQREYLLKIVSDMGRVILPEWIQFYDFVPKTYESSYLYTAVGIDLAISKSDTADYTAMVSADVYRIKEKLHVFIRPNPVNERLRPSEALDRAVALAHELDYPYFYVEEIGYQGMFIESLEREGCYNVEGVKVKGQDKRSRLGLVSHMVKNGEVFFPREGAKRLIAQLVDFGTEKHDDLADAFSILLQKLLPERNISFELLVLGGDDERDDFADIRPVSGMGIACFEGY